MSCQTLGTAGAVTVAATGSIAVGLIIGTALAGRAITDDPHGTARTILIAAVLVGIAADLLYMAPLARRLVGLYLEDLRAWHDARYCRRNNIPVEGLGEDVQGRVAATLSADAARLLEQGGAS